MSEGETGISASCVCRVSRAESRKKDGGSERRWWERKQVESDERGEKSQLPFPAVVGAGHLVRDTLAVSVCGAEGLARFRRRHQLRRVTAVGSSEVRKTRSKHSVFVRVKTVGVLPS